MTTRKPALEVRKAVLAAGGTGGHMFPAEALARALMARGVAVALVTDRRGGSVRMMLQGSAAAQGGGRVGALRDSALQAAVRGALRPLGRSLPNS